MVKFILILLEIIFVAITTCSASNGNNGEGKGFIYIGSFRSKTMEGTNLETPRYDINNYFISSNPAIWSTAERDCQNIFGPNVGLVAIETIAEWEFLRVALESYGFGTTYWTSGLYDPTTNVWRWTYNHFPLPPYPPWGPGYPSNPPNTSIRVLIYYTSRYDAYWRTVSDSQSHRYICEIRTSQC